MSRFEHHQSLSSLPIIAEDTILATLRERYLNNKPYTTIGDGAGIIVVNPLTDGAGGERDQSKRKEEEEQERLREYEEEYYKLGGRKQSSSSSGSPSGSSSSKGKNAQGRGEGSAELELEPHVYRLANDAFYHMKRTGQDQGILIR